MRETKLICTTRLHDSCFCNFPILWIRILLYYFEKIFIVNEGEGQVSNAQPFRTHKHAQVLQNLFLVSLKLKNGFEIKKKSFSNIGCFYFWNDTFFLFSRSVFDTPFAAKVPSRMRPSRAKYKLRVSLGSFFFFSYNIRCQVVFLVKLLPNQKLPFVSDLRQIWEVPLQHKFV